MTDKDLLKSYVILEPCFSSVALVGYAKPLKEDFVTIYSVNDKPIKTCTLKSFFVWAEVQGYSIEPPLKEEWSEEDEIAWKKIQAMQTQDDVARMQEIKQLLRKIEQMLR